MELVAAAKVRHVQANVRAARPYADKIQQVISGLATLRGVVEEIHPLLTQRPVQHIGIILLTTDRGLVGSLNEHLNRRAAALVLELRPAKVSLISIGRRGRDFFRRLRIPLWAEFGGIPDYPSLADTLPVSRLLIDDYLNGLLDAVYMVYPKFVSTMGQQPVVHRLLPIKPPAAGGELHEIGYIFEPSPQAVLVQLLPRYVEMQVYQAVLELKASEHSARMVAMHRATAAAKELLQDLTLTYNKARQDRVTEEMLDILRSAEAIQPRREHVAILRGQLQAMLDESRNRVHAEVVTAIPLSKEEQDKIVCWLVTMTGGPVEIETTVDPGILGGLMVRIGDHLIDGSIRTKLRSLHRRLAYS